jgi:hypothetical protein
MLQRIQAGIGGNFIQPGSEGCPPFISFQTPPCPQKSLLDLVFGILQRTEHPVAMGQQLVAKRFCSELNASLSLRAAARVFAWFLEAFTNISFLEMINCSIYNPMQ